MVDGGCLRLRCANRSYERLPRSKSTFVRISRPRRNHNLDVAHDLKPFRARVHSSTGTHEALNTTVFVKEENGGFGVKPLYLAQEEVDGCGFTYPRLTDDHGVGNVIRDRSPRAQ